MSAVERAVRSVWARAAVTAVLLGAVALSIDWSTVGERLAGGRWGWFAAAAGLLVAALAVGGVRWHLLLQGAGLRPSPRHTARAYAIGAFSNNVLPTSFGGDAVRAVLVARRRADLLAALLSVAADRAIALACLVAAAWIAAALQPGAVPAPLAASLAAVTAAATAAAAAALLAGRGGAGGRLAARLPERGRRLAARARETLAAYAGDRRLLAVSAGLGLAYQGLAVGSTCLAARAIGLELAFGLVAVVVALVLVATLMPISIAGFGVREASFVVLLGQAGVSASDAAVVSLLSVAAMTVASLPGAVAMLSSRRARPAAEHRAWDAAGATLGSPPG